MVCSRSGRVREDNRIKNNVAGDLPRVCVLTLVQIGMLSESNMRLSTIIQTSVFAMWTIDLTIRSPAPTPAVGGSIVRPDSGEERHVQVESVYKWVSFEKVWATGEAHHEADAPGTLGLTPISFKKTWMGREGEGKCSSVSSTESAMIRNSGPSCVYLKALDELRRISKIFAKRSQAEEGSWSGDCIISHAVQRAARRRRHVGGHVVEGAQAIRKGGAAGVQGWDLQIEVSLRIVLAGKGKAVPCSRDVL